MADTGATTTIVRMDDGVRLNVRVLGDDLSKVKPLLIAHHGAPGLSSLAEPEASFGFLADVFRILVFDARGSGASDLIGPYDHSRWIKDIETLRQWAGAEKFVLAGGSYGGFIALDYALIHGDRLLGLVLRDTFAYGVMGMMTALANILTSDVVKVDVARQLRTWTGTLHDDADFRKAFEEIAPIYAPPKNPQSASSPPKESTSQEFNGSNKKKYFHAATQNAAFSKNMPRFDVRHRLNEIKVPALVIVGRHDKVAPLAASQEIANGIPRARLVIFEHSGHSPPSDEPEKFQKTVLEFLRDEVLQVNVAET